MKPDKVLVVHFEPGGVLEELERLFGKHEIPALFRKREDIKPTDFKGVDLVISVGGDGTFLAAARHVEDAFMLGINSHPDRKEGFLTRATIETLERAIEQILNNEFVVAYLTRLRSTLNGEDLPLALNEVFISSENPTHMSVYRLAVGENSEVQKSSGVIVGTATGSHGWLKSAGGVVMPIMAREFQYHIREPFEGKLMKCTMLGELLAPDTVLKIESLMEDGIVIMDASRIVHAFPKGSTIEVTTSPRRLKIIEFPEEEHYAQAKQIQEKKRQLEDGPNVLLDS